MLRPLIVVTGTGTGIGKTHLACALLRAWGRRSKVCGVKPVESGVAGILGDDAIRLAAASTFHVTHPPPYTFPDPISPHLAARRVGAEVRPDVIARYVAEVREAAEGTLVELAGGLFSPVTDRALNADIARMLQPTATLLVAPDRLGVLHDLGATTRAAEREGVRLAGVALVAPELPDASTGNERRGDALGDGGSAPGQRPEGGRGGAGQITRRSSGSCTALGGAASTTRPRSSLRPRAPRGLRERTVVGHDRPR